jgi:hypothetical protein
MALTRARIASRCGTGAVLTLTAALLLAQSPATATTHGRNGRIVFRRYFNDAHTRGALFTIDPDDTGLRRLTHPPAQPTSPPSPTGRQAVVGSSTRSTVTATRINHTS